MQERTIQVGAFELSEATDGRVTVSGPAAYMRSTHYARCRGRIAAGQSAVINYAPEGSDYLTLIGVAIQTDYAGWRERCPQCGPRTLGLS